MTIDSHEMRFLPNPSDPIRRLVVVGCCGAGKSRFSLEAADRLAIPYVERDTLGDLGSTVYADAVRAVVRGNAWVFDGPPYYVEELVYSAAQVIVWLDFSRRMVLWRATRRALQRTLLPPEPDQDRWRRLRHWIEPGGPRFAWSVYAERKREFAGLQQRGESGGKVIRFATPGAAHAWLVSLAPRGEQT